MELALRTDGDLVLVPVRVQPRARRTEIVGVMPSGALKVKLQAPPVDGAANEALLRFLAREVLGVAPSDLVLVRGHTSRDKVVGVRGIDIAAVRRRIADGGTPAR